MSSSTDKPKGFHEAFARFFEKPKRDTLRELLKNNVGEHTNLDFKREWPCGPKLAKHVLGFANSCGGALVIGVAEVDGVLQSLGLSEVKDKADVVQSFKKFVPDTLRCDIHDFSFNDSEYRDIKGKSFQVLIIEDTPELLPFLSEVDGDEIDAGAVYVRDGAATQRATHHQLQNLLNRRIETKHSSRRELTVREHFEELRVLYDLIRSRIPNPAIMSGYSSMQVVLSAPNPLLPQENFEAFVARMIDAKKKLIEHLVNTIEK